MGSVQVETVLSMPIKNPETGASSRSFRFMGKTDRREGPKVIDWKGVDNPARFIQQCRIGFQAEVYALAWWELHGVPIQEIEYRLITRPTIKYKTPNRSWACTKPSRKSAVRIFDNEADAKKLAALQSCDVEPRCAGNPTREHYEKECMDWLWQGGGRRLVTHNHLLTTAKLEQAKWWIWECSKRILDSRRMKRWIPNVHACHNWNRECPYIELCDAVQNGADWQWIVDERFEARKSSHPELDGADNGADILTHSSAKDLASCEMLYQWRHERKLRKRADEHFAARDLGSAMHRGLEAFAGDGIEAAYAAIDTWQDDNPILGEDAAWRQDEQVARARAMVRVAYQKWPQPTETPNAS